MVLASQQGRPGSGRSDMFAKRRRSVGRWAYVLFLAILIGVGWMIWPRDAGTLPEDAGVADAGGTTSPPGGGDSPGVLAGAEPQERPERGPALPDPGAAEDESTGVIVMGEGLRNEPILPEPQATEQAQPEVTPPPVRQPTSPGVNEAVLALMNRGSELVRANELVRARDVYNQALTHPAAGIAAEEIRERLTEINEVLVFSPTVVRGDPFAESYTFQRGDYLVRIAPRYDVYASFLQRINRVADPSRINAGASLKMIRGPFHAQVDKSDYRLDLYLGGPPGSASAVYVRSFAVGLGENDSTPNGGWIVRENSRTHNPSWRNPRTGEFFKPDDPLNPIGDYWIGMRGTDPDTSAIEGIGLHGTIEPESIGRQMSMGCIRLLDDDIALLFDCLVEGKSTVTVQN